MAEAGASSTGGRMMIRVLVFLVLSVSLGHAAAAANRYHLPEDENQWLDRIYFLTTQDFGRDNLALLVQDINEGRRSDVPITALQQAPVRSAGFLMGPIDVSDFRGGRGVGQKQAGPVRRS